MRDTLSPDGAHKLSIQIQRYWMEQGVKVRVKAVRIELKSSSVPSNMWAIRSNLSFNAQGCAIVKGDP